MKPLKTFFQNKQVRTVLDVGTGTGDFVAVLKEVFPEAKITGVDPNTKSLTEAAKLFPGVDFVDMGGEHLDFADDQFDVASISMALHHLPDITKTLAEMQRVVKPRGWIIVNELFSDNLNPAQEVHKLMHHFRSKIDRLNGVSHNETLTKAEILELVENSGVTILHHFENKKERKPTTDEEINERIAKLNVLLDTISHRPEYPNFVAEAKEINAGLKLHGFAMATRVVIIGVVS
ncbi:methyltransferase domain-containing protein [Prolixibacteraceae bacterium Z1-6]|uniref:Methyltransferase domain-containing protein n=1 Tax=Draconibacterium aestuarii TaxID=2998507 RepID=A0A9X3J780_9BACT|nr:methyltransferase domain-containing protein [Prolixibacteraceae bacterium Z1-6]